MIFIVLYVIIFKNFWVFYIQERKYDFKNISYDDLKKNVTLPQFQRSLIWSPEEGWRTASPAPRAASSTGDLAARSNPCLSSAQTPIFTRSWRSWWIPDISYPTPTRCRTRCNSWKRVTKWRSSSWIISWRSTCNVPVRAWSARDETTKRHTHPAYGAWERRHHGGAFIWRSGRFDKTLQHRSPQFRIRMMSQMGMANRKLDQFWNNRLLNLPPLTNRSRKIDWIYLTE